MKPTARRHYGLLLAVAINLVLTIIGAYTAGKWAYQKVTAEPELLSPLPDEPECVQFNIEIVPAIPAELEKNEKKPVSPTITEPTRTTQLRPTYTEGTASYYNREICTQHSRTYGVDCFTASGELFDDTALTAACPRSLLGQKIKVTSNQNSVVVTCNDTGAFEAAYGRVLDLSEAAFTQLAPKAQGVTQVAYQSL